MRSISPGRCSGSYGLISPKLGEQVVGDRLRPGIPAAAVDDAVPDRRERREPHLLVDPLDQQARGRPMVRCSTPASRIVPPTPMAASRVPARPIRSIRPEARRAAGRPGSNSANFRLEDPPLTVRMNDRPGGPGDGSPGRPSFL